MIHVLKAFFKIPKLKNETDPSRLELKSAVLETVMLPLHYGSIAMGEGLEPPVPLSINSFQDYLLTN